MKNKGKQLAESIFNSLKEGPDQKYKNPKTGRTIGYEYAKQLGIVKAEKSTSDSKVKVEPDIQKVKGKEYNWKDPEATKLFRKTRDVAVNHFQDEGELEQAAKNLGLEKEYKAYLKANYKEDEDYQLMNHEQFVESLIDVVVEKMSKGAENQQEADTIELINGLKYPGLDKYFK